MALARNYGVMHPLPGETSRIAVLPNRTLKRRSPGQAFPQVSRRHCGRDLGLPYPDLAGAQFDLIVHGHFAGLSGEMRPCRRTIRPGALAYDMVTAG